MPIGTVEISLKHRTLRFPATTARTLVRSVLRQEGFKLGTVAVSFVNDRIMTTVNERHLRHRGTTDVITFTYAVSPEIDGEIVVNLDQARRQAPAFGERYTDEVRRLIVHGALHLAGHDDRTPRLRERMHKREDLYL